MKRRMEKKSFLARYNNLRKLRDSVKGIQQLSWNLSAFEKKFPFEDVGEDSIDDYFRAYRDFGNEVDDVARCFKEVEKETDRNKKNGDENNKNKTIQR